MEPGLVLFVQVTRLQEAILALLEGLGDTIGSGWKEWTTGID